MLGRYEVYLYLVNIALLMVFIFIYIYIQIYIYFKMRAYVSQLICHFGRIWRFFMPPLVPFSVLAFFVPKDFLGLFVPRNMGPSVPSSMGPSVPVLMDLRVILRCQIVCVYLTCFLISG